MGTLTPVATRQRWWRAAAVTLSAALHGVAPKASARMSTSPSASDARASATCASASGRLAWGGTSTTAT
jgi:hypothetical protein